MSAEGNKKERLARAKRKAGKKVAKTIREKGWQYGGYAARSGFERKKES